MITEKEHSMPIRPQVGLQRFDEDSESVSTLSLLQQNDHDLLAEPGHYLLEFIS
jgi:hypothetical protein